jgi:hypothetical protein
LCAPGYHAYVEAAHDTFLFCSRCGSVVRILPARTQPPPRAAEPTAAPVAVSTPDVDEQAALDEVIYNLMREADLDPGDPVQRAEFLAVAAEVPPVTIDGRTFSPHGTNGSTRVPVDGDRYNENLPDPGL